MGEDGKWSARDLARAIGYARFRNFEPCVLQARDAITELSGVAAGQEHVADERHPSVGGNGAVQMVKDYRLTRYGAYMALGYSSKPELKHYFATKTREAETRPAFDPARLSRRDILRNAYGPLGGLVKAR